MTSRRLLAPLAVLLVTAGCAATTMTPAQELAWEQWKACDHFNGIKLDRIAPDGRISALGVGATGEGNLWQQCIQDVQARQRARRGAPTEVRPTGK
jgi:hypothetical protein